jgi:AcrR family transcriptional regulator
MPMTRPELGRATLEGRVSKRRRATRARLLEAAYHVIMESGVDDAKIKDITDRADVGFGTFFNYFETKDDLANQVLDCVINDLARRNRIATSKLKAEDDSTVRVPLSMRIVMREATTAAMWRWWALRPDLLVDRIRRGFRRYALEDISEAMAGGIFHIDEGEIDSTWTLAVWMLVGGIHDVVVGNRVTEWDMFVVEAIMRAMGAPLDIARRISRTRLPKCPPAEIDWTFNLDEQPLEGTKSSHASGSTRGVRQTRSGLAHR